MWPTKTEQMLDHVYMFMNSQHVIFKHVPQSRERESIG